jgi:hypothetical protein
MCRMVDETLNSNSLHADVFLIRENPGFLCPLQSYNVNDFLTECILAFLAINLSLLSPGHPGIKHCPPADRSS